MSTHPVTDPIVAAARAARKLAERERKAAAAVKPRPEIVEPDPVHHSDDDRALYALLLGRPALCERLYRRVVCSTVWTSGTAMQGALICDSLFDDAPGNDTERRTR